MAKPYKLVKMPDRYWIDILKSEEFYQDMEDIARAKNPDPARYEVVRNKRVRRRAAVRIVDYNFDAISHEIETGQLASLAPKEKTKPKAPKCRAKDPANCRHHETGKYSR